MTITNKSGITLLVSSEIMKPGTTKRYNNKNDDFIFIQALEGSCKIIVTTEGKVKFQSEGKLKAKFSMRKDRTGMKVINIVSV